MSFSHFRSKIRKCISPVFVLLCVFLFASGVSAALAAGDVAPVTFHDNPDPVAANGIVTYTVDVHNNHGFDTANSPSLVLTVPDGFSFVSVNDVNCSASNAAPSDGSGTVDCSWASLAPETSYDVEVELRASSITALYQLTATATSVGDGNTNNDIENNITEVVESADLILSSKSSTPEVTVSAGGILTYSFEVQNDGPYDAENLALSDQLPVGLTFYADNSNPAANEDGDWVCTNAGQDVSCVSSTLGNGGTSIFSFRVKVTTDTLGSITNSASVTSDTPEPNPNNNTATDDVEIVAGTDISVAKTVDTDPVIGGQPTQFTVTVTNLGPMTAADVEVVDPLPSGYTAISANPPAGWSCTVAGTAVTCTKTSMISGEVGAIIVTATPAATNSVVTHQNSATVSTSTSDPISENDTVTVDYTVSPDIADLSLTKTKSPDPVAQGSDATSIITVVNNGPRPADPVQVVDVLSPDETYVIPSPADPNWTCTHSDPDHSTNLNPGGIVTCDYNNVPLAAGATATHLTIITTATNAGILTNTACTGGAGGSNAPTFGDTLTGNNCNNGSVISTSDRADLIVTKITDDAYIDTSESSFTYTVTIHNDGPNTSEAVDFTDTVPQYVSAGTGGRPATSIVAVPSQGTCSVTNALVECGLGTIAFTGDNTSDATVAITVTRPMLDGTRINTASAYSTLTGDPDRSNNSDDAVVEVIPIADIEVTSKAVTYANHPANIFAGTTATYTIQVRNNGPSEAVGVQLADVFTGELFTYLSYNVAGSGSCDPFDTGTRTLNCDLGDMAANTTKSITVEIRPDHQLVLPDPWEIYNTATASMTTADSNSGNNSKSLTLLVDAGQIDLAVEKNESPDFIEPVRFHPAQAGSGNRLVYEIVISNRGPSLATGVTFIDNVVSVIPAGGQQLQFIGDSANADGSDSGSNVCNHIGDTFTIDGSSQNITCQLAADPGNPLGELAVGTPYTRYLVFEVLDTPDPIIGDVYRDQVVVSGNEVETSSGNNTEDESTTVRTEVDLGILKTGPAGLVEVEEHFDLTLTVTNHGPGSSPQTSVLDNLPSGMVLTAQPTSVPSGTCTGGANDTSFTCDLALLASGDVRTITVPVKLTSYPSGGTITNTAYVSGLAPEPDPDSTNPNEDPHTVSVHQPAILGDYVWLDRNANGVQDGGEPAIQGVTVNLRDSSGTTILDSTTTDSSGNYLFSINHAANYIVEFIKPDGTYIFSPQSFGGDDSVDSDVDPADGRISVITANYGDTITTVDAGMYQLVRLGSRVWEDLNADGTQDIGELNIPDVAVELFNSADVSQGTTTTDTDGLYSFVDLEPGDYYVQITPATWIGFLPSPVQTADPDNNNNNDSNININASAPAGTHQSGTVTLLSQDEPTTDGDDHNGNLTVDFGLVLPARLGNLIWLDENSDGIQDAGESGIANVTIQLLDSSGTLLSSTVSDSHGGYLFKELAPGDYFIKVPVTPAGMAQTSVHPNSGMDFSNQNQSVSHGYGVHLNSSGENLTADFGYNYTNGALGDRIWIDSNGDGIQDAAEAGVTGAELTMYSPGPDGLFWTGDDVTEATTTTDGAGNYYFNNLAAGAYTVEVTGTGTNHDILSATDYTQTGDPDHFATSSATSNDNRSTLPIILGPGDTFVNVDFGYQPQPSADLYDIGDFVWVDANRNGALDAEELGISGISIGLQNVTGAFIATTTTSTNGSYLFEDLPDAKYTVVIIDSNAVLAQMVPTFDQDNGTTNPDEQSTLTLSGSDNLDQDFGYTPVSANSGSAMIGDTIFLDRDISGSPNPGEGVEGVRVILRNNIGDILAVTRTNENGTYLFGGLAAATYTVEVDITTLPVGISNSVDPDGGFDSESLVTLASGEINLLQDFGYLADVPGSIGDLIWKDVSADGLYQPDGLDGQAGTSDDETAFADVSLDLYLDTNANQQIDPGEQKIASTTSSVTGSYLFAGLPAADYNVKVTDTANILAGFWHSLGTADTNDNSQIDYFSISLSAGQDVDYADFAYYSEPGIIGDRVWSDDDGNGVYQSANDTGLAGVTVLLDIVFPDATVVTLQTITDGNGLYQFSNLLLDENYNGIGASYGDGGDEPSHTVRLDGTTIPTGLTSIFVTRGSNVDTTDVGGNLTDDDDQDMGSDNPVGEPGYPPMGSKDTSNDFGYFVPGSIGDTIWHDMNNDGLVDSGEALAAITVRLTPPTDVDLGNGLGVTINTITDSNGEYLFSGLPAGTYNVTVDQTDLPLVLQGSNTVDPDGANDSTATVTLTPSQNNIDQDFAYFVPGTIGNYVWNDTNGNGIQDAGESGRQGISVHLLDGSGLPVYDPLHPAIPYILPTGHSGEYLFENLIPGTYQVQFVLPVNNNFTIQNGGSDASLDSDADIATGRVTVLLQDSETNLTIDAGLIGPGINIEKSTNANDADIAPGIVLGTGDTVTWEYVVTNTGNVPLSNVTVFDNRISSISCPQNSLNSGASMTCTASGIAVAGQYSNIGTVIGTPPSGPAVTDSDPSHYLAGSLIPAIDIEKYTNGVDADTGTGPVIAVGDPVIWNYVVTNIGSVDLSGITVTDDMIGAVSCPQSTLVASASMTCTATGVAIDGQYTNIGSVTGTPAVGPAVTDSDPSHYIGSHTSINGLAGLTLQKATNDKDADTAPGPRVKIGHPVTWTYVVQNTGNVDLSNVTVSDDKIANTEIHCPDDGNTDNRITLLPVNAMVRCTATGIAVEGQYENIGTVIGTPPIGPDVTATDPSHYLGKTFNWAMFLPAATPRCPSVPDYCYMVADRDNVTSRNSPLLKYTWTTKSLELLNRLGVDDVEAITLSLDGKSLYAADNGVLGIIDPTVGRENSFTALNATGLGYGRGELGYVELDDIDGLAFDPKSGVLYGTVRRNDYNEKSLDLLVQINHENGQLIRDAFYDGVDYVLLQTDDVNAGDIDDIAIDRDGVLFGIAGNSGGVRGLGGDMLVIVDKETGIANAAWPVANNGVPVQDMEGLTSYSTQLLYGTTGVEFNDENTDNTLYEIEMESGQATPIIRLDQNFDGYIPGDFEAISCFPVCR